MGPFLFGLPVPSNWNLIAANTTVSTFNPLRPAETVEV
jgi:hypothetical protein